MAWEGEESPTVIVPALARADDARAPERTHASRQVYDRPTAEIDAAAKGDLAHAVRECGRPAVLGPHPVGDDGVDEADDHKGVDEIRAQLTPLGHRTAHDRARVRRKHILEEEVNVLVAGRVLVGANLTHEEELVGAVVAVGHADELVLAVRVLRNKHTM